MSDKVQLIWIWSVLLSLLTAAIGQLGWGIHALSKSPPARRMWLTCEEMSDHRDYCKSTFNDADWPQQ